MAEKLINKSYMQSFWGLIKDIPYKTNYGVRVGEGETANTITNTIALHLKELYTRVSNDLKAVGKAEDSYEGLSVTTTDNNVVIGLDLSGFSDNEIDSILNSIGEGDYIKITKTTSPIGIQIKIGDEVYSKINSALSEVAVDSEGYLQGNGTTSSPININGEKISNATPSYTGDDDDNKLATKGYIDTQMSTKGGVRSVTGDNDIVATKNSTTNAVVVDLSNGIKSDIANKVNTADVTGGSNYVTNIASGNAINFDIDENKVTKGQNDGNNPVLTTQGYVDEVASSKNNTKVTVSSGKAPTPSGGDAPTLVKFTEDNNTHIYYINLTSNDNVVYNIKLDASTFVTDKYLKSADVVGDNLELVWHNADGSESKTDIPLTNLINNYSAGDGLEVEEKTKTDGTIEKKISLSIGKDNQYLGFDGGGNLVVTNTTNTSNEDDNLTTKSYVDYKTKDIIQFKSGDGVGVDTNTDGLKKIKITPKADGGIGVDEDGVYVKTKSDGYVGMQSDDVCDDAARVILGGDCRIPTVADFEELMANVTWTNSSTGGTIARSNINNAEINLCGKQGNSINDGNYTELRTANVDTNNPQYSMVFVISDDYCYGACRGITHSIYKNCTGATIRPVSKTATGDNWIDLGLPSGLKWAKYNLKATGFAAYNGYGYVDNGDFFAFGETTPYTNVNNYKFGTVPNSSTSGSSVTVEYEASKSSSNSFTKYNREDGKTVLDLEGGEVFININDDKITKEYNTSTPYAENNLTTQSYVDSKIYGEITSSVADYGGNEGVNVVDNGSNSATISVKLDTTNSNYLTFDADKKLTLNPTKIANNTTITDIGLTTKGYVDEKADSVQQMEFETWVENDTDFSYN